MSQTLYQSSHPSLSSEFDNDPAQNICSLGSRPLGGSTFAPAKSSCSRDLAFLAGLPSRDCWRNSGEYLAFGPALALGSCARNSLPVVISLPLRGVIVTLSIPVTALLCSSRACKQPDQRGSARCGQDHCLLQRKCSHHCVGAISYASVQQSTTREFAGHDTRLVLSFVATFY